MQLLRSEQHSSWMGKSVTQCHCKPFTVVGVSSVLADGIFMDIQKGDKKKGGFPEFSTGLYF